MFVSENKRTWVDADCSSVKTTEPGPRPRKDHFALAACAMYDCSKSINHF
jgi:hypothetical protein